MFAPPLVDAFQPLEIFIVCIGTIVGVSKDFLLSVDNLITGYTTVEKASGFVS
jgi:hypothetical protein